MSPRPGGVPGGGRDVVVVGASAGGLEALRRIVGDLPADLPASVLVVVHRGDREPNLLPEILAASGPLPAAAAGEGEPLERGRIYVAPSDRHLLVGADHVHVRRGPHENRARPAIDPLFRSAAASCTTRVVAVVLSGLLDDGASGLRAVERCGGAALVQDPADAAYADMPRNALAHVPAARVLPAREIGAALAALARGPRPPAVEVPEQVRLEAMIPALEVGDVTDRLGRLSPLTCPECHGVVYEIEEGGLLRYRCHTGHAFTARALGASQDEALERSLYAAMRTQEEQALLARRMAEEAGRAGDARGAAEMRRRAARYAEGRDMLLRLIAAGDPAEAK